MIFKGSDLCFAGHRVRFMPEDLGLDEIDEKLEVTEEKRHANVHPVFRKILEEIGDVKS